MGQVVYCENAGEVTSPHLLSILRKDITNHQGYPRFGFNDLQVEFDNDFRIYIFSHLANPHFSPEVQQLSKVLQFSITREGLEQQLLQVIAERELADEETKRKKLAKESLENQKKKRVEFEKILNTLKDSSSDILESDSFVKTLNESKETTTDIEKKLKASKNQEERIKEMREKFVDTAKQGARLYFAVQDMQMLDEMYQFSMSWFIRIFKQTFNVSEPGSDDEEEKSANDASDTSVIAQPKRKPA